MTHHVFVSMPVARGVDPRVMWNVFEWRTELEKVGHRLHGSSTLHVMADLARSELATVFLSTTCDIALLLDDDCQVSPTWIPKMVAALDAGCDILSAPCLLRNHGGGHYNHSLFWTLMGPEKMIDEKLVGNIKETFGSVDEFKKQFTDTAAKVFGSGWAWLAKDENGKLHMHGLPNQDNPLMHGHTPVLCLDVWEHAYYLKYQNRRPEYIENWWKVLKLI